MKLARTPVLLLTLLLPGLCAAEDYAISGPSLAGKATLTTTEVLPDETRLVTVDASWTTADRFKNEYATQKVEAAPGRVDPDGVLTFSYKVELAGNVWHGLTARLGNPFGWGRRSEADRHREVSVTLRPFGPLKLTGGVDGVTHTWTRQSLPDDVIVLAIPGLSTNNWNRVGIPYMDENLAALEARGIEARRLAISTESSVRTNALFIAREVTREGARGKRVIIMAHSKGATDTTAALALYPYLLEHVEGVIAIQPVYGGSPVAGLVKRLMDGNQGVDRIAHAMADTVFKGSTEAVTDLVPANRRAFVAEHPYPAERVPTVVVRSYFERPGMRGFTVLTLNQRKITQRLGKRNDGMVTLEDQVIPGAVETIDFDDLDHFEPGVRAHSPYSPTDVTNAAVDALLRHVDLTASQQKR